MSLFSSLIRVMPVDLAMHMCLNRHPPVQQLLGMSTLRPHHALIRPSTRDSLQPRSARSPQIPASPVSTLSCTRACGTLKKKKRVVFADAKGLALTAVWIFDSDPPVSDVDELCPPFKTKTESFVQSKKPCLQLGFSQPSADFPSFLDRMAKYLVRLESCSLIYGSLFGKVRVCNISPKKAVHIRITFDSWRTHHDIPCTPIPQKNRSSETELFVFNIPVPSCPNVQDRLEFCVTFRPGSGNMLLWDSNGGRNYRILAQDLNSEEAHSVEKKHLRPQNSQNPQSPLRKSLVLSKTGSLSTLTYSQNMSKMLCRQENSTLISTLPLNSNSASKLI